MGEAGAELARADWSKLAEGVDSMVRLGESWAEARVACAGV